MTFRISPGATPRVKVRLIDPGPKPRLELIFVIGSRGTSTGSLSKGR